MKLPDVYHDWRIVLGLALILLGAGNWIIGRERAEEYGQIISHLSEASPKHSYRRFDELGSGANAVLAPFTQEQRRVSYATARMDFYHATFMTGQVLLLLGLVVTFMGFVAVIQRDALRTERRIDVRLGDQKPESR